MIKKIKDRFEIRVSGSGGQGLILAGIILSEAVSIYGRYNVIQSQSYGPEARGGASKAEVIISENEIYYPKAQKLNLLLSLSQDACDKYYYDLRGDGILIVDSTYVKSVPIHRHTYQENFTQYAFEKFGRAIVTNIMCLGFIAGILDFLSFEDMKKAVENRVPKKHLELNLKALEFGYSLVRSR